MVKAVGKVDQAFRARNRNSDLELVPSFGYSEPILGVAVKPRAGQPETGCCGGDSTEVQVGMLFEVARVSSSLFPLTSGRNPYCAKGLLHSSLSSKESASSSSCGVAGASALRVKNNRTRSPAIVRTMEWSQPRASVEYRRLATVLCGIKHASY